MKKYTIDEKIKFYQQKIAFAERRLLKLQDMKIEEWLKAFREEMKTKRRKGA